MSNNLMLSLFRIGLSTALPAVPDLGTNVAQGIYTSDTNALYFWNPVTQAWELQYQDKPVAFASLPTANLIKGTAATVTDATTPTKGGIITGGSNVLTVAVWDGTNWRAG